MNTPNPLIPQGSLLEQQKSKGKSNLFIAVFMILAVHVVVFAGLLMQGCKRDKADAKSEEVNFSAALTNALPDTNALAPLPHLAGPDTSFTPATNLPNTAGTPPATPPANGFTPAVTPPAVAETPVAPPAGTKEYTVAKGDLFYTIAKAHGVSVNALIKANPDANPRKLHAGQKLVIPAAETPAPAAPAVHAAAPSGSEPAPAAPAEGKGATYTVKAGDNLTKIARAHGTTSKAIQNANGLKTTQLKVGQKLKIPAAKPSGAAAAAEAPRANRGSTPL